MRGRPYAGPWERIDSPDLAPPAPRRRQAPRALAPLGWDADLERAYRRLRRRLKRAQWSADYRRLDLGPEWRRLSFGRMRKRRLWEEAQARYDRLADLAQELRRYRPALAGLRSLPLPARRRTALD